MCSGKSREQRSGILVVTQRLAPPRDLWLELESRSVGDCSYVLQLAAGKCSNDAEATEAARRTVV